MNIQRLNRLIEVLESLPKDDGFFDMSVFKKETDCGTGWLVR